MGAVKKRTRTTARVAPAEQWRGRAAGLPGFAGGTDEQVAVAPSTPRRFATPLAGVRVGRPAVGRAERLGRVLVHGYGEEQHTQVPPDRTPDMVNPIQDGIDLVGYFADVALGDPINVVIMLFGFLFVAMPSVVFFGIAIGGILDSILPDQIGRSPPPQER